MPTPNPEALAFLMARRSRPARTLALPVPDRAQVMDLLTAAARVPDHGKLEPWRFVVAGATAMARLAALAQARAEALGLDAEAAAKGRSQFDAGLLAVAVIASPKGTDKVPASEQHLSAGAVCLGLLNAAEAAGWGACWLTGWPANDAEFAAQAFGCQSGETVAGIIHIASETTPPSDRPRPDVGTLVHWLDA